LKSEVTGSRVVQVDAGSIDHCIIVQEVLVERVYDLTLVTFQPDHVVDCGAHIGLFSRLAAARYPGAKLKAFEPNPQNFSWLCRQFDVSDTRVELIEAAVEVREGRAVLTGEGCGGSLMDSGVSGPGQEVALVHLRPWLAAHVPTTEKLLLKIDIEGREFAILPDVLPVLPPTTAILLETHGYGGEEAQLLTLLREAGFSLTLLRSRVTAGISYGEHLAIRL